MRTKIPYTQFIDIDLPDDTILKMAIDVLRMRLGGEVRQGKVISLERCSSARFYNRDGVFLRDATPDDITMQGLIDGIARHKGDKYCE